MGMSHKKITIFELSGMERKDLPTSCAYCTLITDDKGTEYVCTGACHENRDQPLPIEPHISNAARQLTNIPEEQKQ